MSASVEVATGTSCPLEVLRTVYLCWLEVLERADDGARATVTVREEQGALVFDVAEDGAGFAAAGASLEAELGRLRDRVEALGGRLTIQSEPGRGTRVAGVLPIAR
jgi:signal transduction histidine kinase